jgi:hypothetical protein
VDNIFQKVDLLAVLDYEHHVKVNSVGYFKQKKTVLFFLKKKLG